MIDQDLYVLVGLSNKLQMPLQAVLDMTDTEIQYRVAQLDLAHSRAEMRRK